MIFLLVVTLVLLYFMFVYNKLIRLRNQVKNAWSQIDVQLQRRYDLIPNLVETVKGYMNFEKGTLEAVVQARSQAMSARSQVEKSGGPAEGTSLKDLISAETGLKGALTNFFALSENYPQLKASDTMRNLQEELSSTENKIAFSRQAYNDQAMNYNTAQETFPAVLVARFFGHHHVDMYQVAEEQAKQAVKVSF